VRTADERGQGGRRRVASRRHRWNLKEREIWRKGALKGEKNRKKRRKGNDGPTARSLSAFSLKRHQSERRILSEKGKGHRGEGGSRNKKVVKMSGMKKKSKSVKNKAS